MAKTKVVLKEDLRAKVEDLVKRYNEAVQKGDFNKSTKLDDEIANLCGEYTAIARAECFEALKATSDPMLYAVKQLTFPTIKTRDTKEGEEKIPVRIVEDTEKPIDLLRLHKAVDGGIGADKRWAYMVEKLNLLLTCQKAQDLGIDPKSVNNSYAMNDISRDIDLGKTPTSKTNILRTLQTVVSAMVGEEFKATSHDVNYLISIYSKKNRKALTVTCANHKYMRQYLAEICHRIVEGKTYALDYKQIKNK